VGLVAQSLYAKNIPVYDEVESFKFQTLQVSAVSVMNCVGRIFIGERVWHSCTQTNKMVNFHRHIRGFCREQVGSAPGVLHSSSCHVFLHLSVSGNVYRGCEGAMEGQLVGRFLIRLLVWVIPDDHHRLVWNEYVLKCLICIYLQFSPPDSSLFRELGNSDPFTHDRRKSFLPCVRKEHRWAHLGRTQSSADDIP
jgi:hypothetical protein